MSFGILSIALTLIFVVFVVVLAGECVYFFRRRRTFRHRSSPHPPTHSDETPKEMLYFFFFKPETRVELDLHGAPTKNTNESQTDQVTRLYFSGVEEKHQTLAQLDLDGAPKENIDGSDQVTRLCFSDVEEEEKEVVESTVDVDFLKKVFTKYVCLQTCVKLGEEVEEEEEVEDVVVVTVDEDDGTTKTVFSTPCDSPSFFTPVGSPSRDLMEMGVFVVSDHETGNGDERWGLNASVCDVL